MKRIGIIAAMAVEVDTLKAQLQDSRSRMLAGTEYFLGTVGGWQVVLTQCGIGKVSAAIGAQAMITDFHPDVIINTGCAGALDPQLKVGDLVLADATVEWDLDITAIGIPRGYVSALDRVRMTADAGVTDGLAAVIGAEETVVRGLVVSGDQFVSAPEQRQLILGTFPDARCAEMEGGAIGHVCAQNGVPFCVIRCMSDTADGNSGVSFAEFAQTAGEKSADILLRFLRQ